MIKNISLLAILIFIFVLFTQVLSTLTINDFSKTYFLNNALSETASHNIVTAIYLDYRLFDSIFEASTLLIAVSGIIFISTKDGEETKPVLIFEKMKVSSILTKISRLLYPFMLMFGMYIIIHGHISVGGGFQGGAILATAVLITYYIDPEKISNINFFVKLEKLIFIFIIIISSLSVFTKNIFFTNFVLAPHDFRIVFLILLNLFIGLKVCLGLVNIFTSFLKEGRI